MDTVPYTMLCAVAAYHMAPVVSLQLEHTLNYHWMLLCVAKVCDTS